ncbi:interferon-induced protein 44-like [Haliotis rufescens]|uniref:interferon-induced protein 44-like n=1 Tax=Haliotis rufescens TaxID=6454 RepID=UPI00201EE2C9|nr:interferon-induced protein 44-like [Haliotis rufescens]
MAKRLSAKFSRNPDWRGHPPFTEETRHELLEYVTSWRPSELVQKTYGQKAIRLLIFGPSGHGKSSFISSIKSCLDGEIGQGAVVGEGMAQVSRQYNEHPMIYKGEDLPFVLCDSRGLHEEGGGAGIDGIRMIITGQFQQGEIMPTHEEMIIDPVMPFKATDLPLGIIFVVDATKSDMLWSKLSFRLYLEKIIDFLNDNEIPRCVVMTHTDAVVSSDLKTTFSNKLLESAAVSAGNLFRVPKNNVYPVKCYTEETGTKKKVDILLLCALKGILIAARHRAEFIARLNTRSQIRDHGFEPRGRRASYI